MFLQDCREEENNIKPARPLLSDEKGGQMQRATCDKIKRRKESKQEEKTRGCNNLGSVTRPDWVMYEHIYVQYRVRLVWLVMCS